MIDNTLREKILGDLKHDISEKEQELTKITAEIERQIERRDSAKEDGDLSENAAYANARSELDRLEFSRVNLINQIDAMRHAVLPSQPSGFVAVGSIVTVQEVDGPLNRTFILLDHALGDAEKSRVSVESPVGKAILNKCAGETVIVVTSVKTIKYQITEVA